MNHSKPTQVMRYLTACLIYALLSIPGFAHAALPGDCDANGIVTSAEIDSAKSMCLGTRTVLPCVDLDGNGTVTAAELQKSINAFLQNTQPTQQAPGVINTRFQIHGSRLVFASSKQFDMPDGQMTIAQYGQTIASFPVKQGRWYAEIPAAFVSPPSATISYTNIDGATVQFDLPIPTDDTSFDIVKGLDVSFDDATWARYQGYMRFSGIVPAGGTFSNRHGIILEALVNPLMSDESILFPPPGQVPAFEALETIDSLDPARLRAEFIRRYNLNNGSQFSSIKDLNSFSKAHFDSRLKLYQLSTEMLTRFAGKPAPLPSEPDYKNTPYALLYYRVMLNDLMNLVFDRGIPYGNWGQLATASNGKLQLISKHYEGSYDPQSSFVPTNRLPIEWAVAFANSEASGHIVTDINVSEARVAYTTAYLYNLSATNTFNMTTDPEYFLIQKPRYVSISDIGGAKVVIDMAKISDGVASLHIVKYLNDLTFVASDTAGVTPPVDNLLRQLPEELMDLILRSGRSFDPALTETEIAELFAGYQQSAAWGIGAQQASVDAYLDKRAADVLYATQQRSFALAIEAVSGSTLRIPNNLKFNDSERAVIEQLKAYGAVACGNFRVSFTDLVNWQSSNALTNYLWNYITQGFTKMQIDKIQADWAAVQTKDKTFAFTVGRTQSEAPQSYTVDIYNRSETINFDNGKYVWVTNHALNNMGPVSLNILSDSLAVSGSLYTYTDCYDYDGQQCYPNDYGCECNSWDSGTDSFQYSSLTGSNVYSYSNGSTAYINTNRPAYISFSLTDAKTNNAILKYALAKKENGKYALMPANYEEGSAEFENLLRSIYGTLCNIYAETKDQNVYLIMKKIESRDFDGLMASGTATSGMIYAEYAADGTRSYENTFKTLLPSGSQKLYCLDSIPDPKCDNDINVTNYLIEVMSAVMRRQLTASEARDAFLAIQLRYSPPLDPRELGYLGNQSLMFLSVLENMVSAGIIGKSADVSDLPTVIGGLYSATTATLPTTYTDVAKETIQTTTANHENLASQMAAQSVLASVSAATQPGQKLLRLAILRKAMGIELRSNGQTFYLDNAVDSQIIWWGFS